MIIQRDNTFNNAQLKSHRGIPAPDYVAFIHEPFAPFRILDTRGPAESLFELPRHIMVGRGVMSVVSPLEKTPRSTFETLLAGESASMNRRLAGTDMHYSSFPVCFRNRSVSVTAFYPSGQPIEPAQPLEEAMPLFRHAFEQSVQATCIMNASLGEIIHFNRLFAKLWQLTPELFLEQPQRFDLSMLTKAAGPMISDAGELAHFMRLDMDAPRVERRLELCDGQVIHGTLHRVNGYDDDTSRYMMSFTRHDADADRRLIESLQRYKRLTPRQKHVAAEVVTGKTNGAIAYGLGVCVKTVEKHRGAAMAKLRVSTVPDLVRLMQRVNDEGLDHEIS